MRARRRVAGRTGPRRRVRLRAGVLARRAHDAGRRRRPVRQLPRSSASTRAPASPSGPPGSSATCLVTMMVSGDGRRVVTTGTETTRWSTTRRTLRPLRRWPVATDTRRAEPGRSNTLLGGARRLGALPRPGHRRGHARPPERHDGGVERAAFSPDGDLGDHRRRGLRRMIVWDVERASAGETLEGHAGPGHRAGVHRRCRDPVLERAGRQGRRLGSRRRPPPRPPVRDRPGQPGRPALRLSPDGRELAIGEIDGSVALIDARTLRPALDFPRGRRRGRSRGMGYVPRGAPARRRRRDGFLALVDRARGRSLKRLPGQRGDRLHAQLQRRRTAHGGTAVADRVQLYALPSGRPRGPRRSRTAPRSRTSRSAPTAARWRLTRPPAGASRSSTCPRSGAARRCRSPRRVWEFAALHARRALPHGRELEGLGAAVVDRDVEARRPPVRRPRRAAWSGSRSAPTAARSPRAAPDGTRPPLGPAHPAAARRPAARPAEPGRSSRSSRPTARTCSRSTAKGGRAYRWDVRPSSWARHACRSPAARSPGPSGATRCPAATTPRPVKDRPKLPGRSTLSLAATSASYIA